MNKRIKEIGIMLLAATSLWGCGEQAEITTYETDKQEAVQAGNSVEKPASNAPAAEAPPMMQPAAAVQAGQPVRMLAAIVPQGSQYWFYKISGPVAAVETQTEQVASFIASVQYDNGEPQWTLPEGWTQKPGNSFRFATIMIPADSAELEMSVSALPGGNDEISQVVDNVNRWRGQVGLESIGAENVVNVTADLLQETSVKEVDGQKIYFVNLLGKQQAGGMRPPFAG